MDGAPDCKSGAAKPQVGSIPTTPTNPNIHSHMRRKGITWQQFVKERECRNVQCVSPSITVQTPTYSKSAEVKASVQLEKLVNDHPRSMFFVLVIVVGLSIRLLNLVVTSLTTARFFSNAIGVVNFATILMLVMVAYKRLNNQKVVW